MGGVDEVVGEVGVGHAVAVDARAATEPVVVDDVLLHHGVGDHPVVVHEARLAGDGGVAVHMNPVGVVAPELIVANRRPVAAVRDVDPVLVLGAGALVALDDQIRTAPGEDAPAVVVVGVVVQEPDVLALHGADAGPGGAGDGKSLHRDVGGPFEVDLFGHGDPRVGQKLDSRIGGAAGGELEGSVGAGLNDDDVPRGHRVCRVLQGLPGCDVTAGRRVAASVVDVVGRRVSHRGRQQQGERHQRGSQPSTTKCHGFLLPPFGVPKQGTRCGGAFASFASRCEWRA